MQTSNNHLWRGWGGGVCSEAEKASHTWRFPSHVLQLLCISFFYYYFWAPSQMCCLHPGVSPSRYSTRESSRPLFLCHLTRKSTHISWHNAAFRVIFCFVAMRLYLCKQLLASRHWTYPIRHLMTNSKTHLQENTFESKQARKKQNLGRKYRISNHTDRRQ